MDGDHMLLFPRSLKQVLQASWTRELHLKFTLGRWNAEEHGAQPGQGMTAGGTGVELWAWIEADDDDEYALSFYYYIISFGANYGELKIWLIKSI